MHTSRVYKGFSDKHQGGGCWTQDREKHREGLTYGEDSNGGTSFPSCSTISLLAMLAMHCMAKVLRSGCETRGHAGLTGLSSSTGHDLH